ncbi:D-alanyl-D-alanine carboxypeptidase family protein [Clostridium sp. DL1XJH146]
MKRKLAILLTSIMLVLSLPINAMATNSDQPEIIGTSALVIDVETGEIIYAKDLDAKNYPASITKLLTGLLLAENAEKVDTIPYTKMASEQNPYSLYNIPNIYINQGDTMSAENVMKALLIYSANDSAYMAANFISNNDYEQYKTTMNEKLSELGMSNSNFVTADGYHDDDHYTTAYDLSLLIRAANENTWMNEVLKTKETKITLDNGTTANIENRNKLIGETLDSGAICIAGKTGYTSDAGRCLAAIFEKDGRKLAGVVLQSQYYPDDTYVFDDMEKIINWSYNAEKTTLAKDSINYVENTEVSTITLKYKPFNFFGFQKEIEVPLVIKDAVNYYQNEINDTEIGTTLKAENIDAWKLNEDEPVGTLEVSQREAKNSYNIYPTISTKDIISQNKFIYIGTILVLLVFILLLIRFVNMARRKKTRGRNKYGY